MDWSQFRSSASSRRLSAALLTRLAAVKLVAMANQLLKSFIVGIQRRWWDGLRNGLATIGGVWALTEMTIAALPAAKTALEAQGGDYLWFMTALFAAAFIGNVFEPTHVTFKVPATDTKITLKYGDIFAENANLLIGVNEYFDGELGVPVAKSTVHGQFIVRNFGGSSTAFRAAVDPALAATGAQPTVTARAIHPNEAYPIGTTIKLPNGPHSTFLMAMARTDPTTSKASSDVPTLWTALKCSFDAIHTLGNGEPLAMPLFGNGQSGIKLEPQHLLRLLILALVDFATNSAARLPKQVAIVLHHSCFSELDIREIARDWKKV
jgi:hypothetical protein